MENYKPFGLGIPPEALPKNDEDADRLWDTVKPLIEQTQEKGGDAKLNELLEKAKKLGLVPGAKVKLWHDDEIGEIMGYNTSIGGFYSGTRYPIVVKFERGTFEYSIEGLKLIKNKKKTA